MDSIPKRFRRSRPQKCQCMWCQRRIPWLAMMVSMVIASWRCLVSDGTQQWWLVFFVYHHNNKNIGNHNSFLTEFQAFLGERFPFTKASFKGRSVKPPWNWLSTEERGLSTNNFFAATSHIVSIVNEGDVFVPFGRFLADKNFNKESLQKKIYQKILPKQNLQRKWKNRKNGWKFKKENWKEKQFPQNIKFPMLKKSPSPSEWRF